MYRWVISPVIGDGSTVIDPANPDTTGPKRPYAAKYGEYLCVTDTDKGWSFMFLRNHDMTEAEADDAIIVMPMLQMDDDLTPAQRTWLGTRLQAKGLPYAWLQQPRKVREALLIMARYIEPEFDTNWFRKLGT